MKEKWFKAVVVLVVLSLTGIASADTVWTGAGENDEWSNEFNWDTGVPPEVGSGNTILGEGNDAGNDYIHMATTATVDGEIYGPEWGIHLDIDGGSLTQLNPSGFVMGGIGETSVTTVRNGGYLQVHNLLVGWSWWYTTPGTTLNVYDTSVVKTTDWMWTGGRINLYDGTIDIAGAVNLLYDPLSKVDIYDGQLIIRTRFPDETRDLAAEAAQWALDGYLVGFGGTGNIIIDTDTIANGVVITAEIPEPATMTLLGLGALAMLRKRK
jgi:hypothetical protein